jgi:hypothetical protein
VSTPTNDLAARAAAYAATAAAYAADPLQAVFLEVVRRDCDRAHAYLAKHPRRSV